MCGKNETFTNKIYRNKRKVCHCILYNETDENPDHATTCDIELPKMNSESDKLEVSVSLRQYE